MNLFIEHTEDTPGVNFNPELNCYELSHRSLPENAAELFGPVIEWVSANFASITTPICFDCKLEYFNTSTANQLARLLLLLERLSQKQKIVIRWFYDKDDTDMLNSGKRYAKLIKLNFEYVEKVI